VKDAATHIHSLLAQKAGAMVSRLPPPVFVAAASASSASRTSAIRVTIAARLPCKLGQFENFNDPIATVPYGRWDLEAPGRTGKSVNRARFGGWVAGIEVFDSTLFGVSAPEAELMDPQQRMLLEAAWEVGQVSYDQLV
jgi:hypothetical protein